MDRYNHILNKLDIIAAKISFIDKLSKNHSIPRAYVLITFATLVFSAVCLILGSNLLSLLIGFLYPAYMSFKALKTHTIDDDIQWLTYWIVFAVFTFFDSIINVVLYWFPWYYPVKIAFLLWCQLPLFNGATFIYKNFLQEFFLRHEKKVDGYLSLIYKVAEHPSDSTVSEIKKEVIKNVSLFGSGRE